VVEVEDMKVAVEVEEQLKALHSFSHNLYQLVVIQ
jgi:hypothetical protein